MKTVKNIAVASILFLSGRSVYSQSAYPVATVQVTCLDKDRHPLSNVLVSGLFSTYRDFYSEIVSHDKKKTDNSGNATVSGRTDKEAGVEAFLKGFYRSGDIVSFNTFENGRWGPSPATKTLILKKIINPVPMYAIRDVMLTLPDNERTFGYDLLKRDWIPPDGAGADADLIFKIHRAIDNVAGSRATLYIECPRPGDGLIPIYELNGRESALQLPRTAPLTGYESRREFTARLDGGGYPPSQKSALGYLCRFRSILDQEGQVKSAWYGKMDREIEFNPYNSTTGGVKFGYYLNPDGTQNLEFNPKRNLFGKLPFENAVTVP